MKGPFDLRARLDPSMDPSLIRALVDDSVRIPDTQQQWNQMDEEHVFTATLPAFDKGIDDEFFEADVDCEDFTLRVNGKQTIEEVKDQETWKLVQGYTLSFDCIIKLPEDVEFGDVTVGIEQSKLTVKLPKSRTFRPENYDAALILQKMSEEDDAALILQKMSSEPKI